MTESIDTGLPYPKSVIEFLTVSAEFCKLMETCAQTEASDFAKQASILLTMLYLKVQFISEDFDSEGFNEDFVTEEDYNFVRQNVSTVLGPADDYLTTNVEDFKFSDQPVLHTVSEDLADLYQVMRNLIEVVRNGYEDAIRAALSDTLEQYRYFWGRVLLNALTALHPVATQEESFD
ncbi:MAG: DUF5063 domain-containing protein [Alloprevotella sp.]|nr:DUF5063 domain-containing protein [Alloprevotella sp.]